MLNISLTQGAERAPARIDHAGLAAASREAFEEIRERLIASCRELCALARVNMSGS
jgi:hypothetical protein